MKRVLLWLLVGVLASCHKEDDRSDVRLTVTCQGCAIQYWDGDGTERRDTMIGDITYPYVDGVVQPDTVPGSLSWNVVLPEGARPRAIACPLPSGEGPITLKASGGMQATAVSDPGQCAQLD